MKENEPKTVPRDCEQKMTVKRICPYPVGEIRLSVDATEPSVIWPGTVWERIENVFLVAAGTAFGAGGTGGSSSHALTSSELPSHVHTVPSHGHANTIAAATPKLSHSVTQPAFSTPKLTHSYTRPTVSSSGGVTNGISGGNHSHTFIESKSKASTKYIAYGPDVGDGTSNTGGTGAHTHNLPNHTHTLTGGGVGDHAAVGCSRTTNVGVGDHAAGSCTMSGSVTDKAAFDTEATGEGEAFSTLPPYLAVHMWKRIA